MRVCQGLLTSSGEAGQVEVDPLYRCVTVLVSVLGLVVMVVSRAAQSEGNASFSAVDSDGARESMYGTWAIEGFSHGGFDLSAPARVVSPLEDTDADLLMSEDILESDIATGGRSA